MKALAIPGAILLGALVGAGGYFVASKLSPRPEPGPRPPATPDGAEVRKALADIQARLAKLEGRTDAARPPSHIVLPMPPTAEPPGPVVQVPPACPHGGRLGRGIVSFDVDQRMGAGH